MKNGNVDDLLFQLQTQATQAIADLDRIRKESEADVLPHLEAIRRQELGILEHLDEIKSKRNRNRKSGGS